MKITILGSGASRINLKRSSPAYLLEVNSKNILIDAGPGCVKQLLKIKKTVFDIDAILFTHFHKDHYLDLPVILGELHHQKDRPELGCYPKLKIGKIKIYGPAALKKIVAPIKRDLPLETRVIGNSKFKLFGLKISSLLLEHMGEIIGYKIENGKRNFTFTSDSKYCKNSIELAKNTDVLIHSVGLPKKFKVTSAHPTLIDVGKVADQAKVKKLVLTHFYPVMDKYNYLKDVRKNYKGPIIAAKDLMKINI
ncbi:MBL fold metallo-hydrolase [Patescibacteria group bacterium]|nr:MBL fold metallo-hydrolase [Patescibacteria group bacterium]